MTGTTNIIFLDCDGVLNHQFAADREYTQSERFGLAQDLVDNLKMIVDSVDNVQIVISSSWRSFRIHEDVHKTINWRCILEHMLGGKQGVVWGDLGMDNEFIRTLGAKGRVEDIKAWLNAHKDMNVSNFVILDDECSELKKAFPNNVIDCDIMSFKGLTVGKAKEAIWTLSNFGRDKKMTSNTWFISDTHFGHGNIIKYCNRPWCSGKRDADNNLIVTDEDVDKMNRDIIAKWNSVVKPDDVVWHLGDFSFGSKDNVKKMLSQLNGKVNLVMGNHDHNKLKFYEDAGFHRVYDRPVIINKYVILSHAPLEFLNDNCPFFNIFGHVHDSQMYKTFSKNSCCVCVERHDYTPVSWEKIQEEYEKLNGKAE